MSDYPQFDGFSLQDSNFVVEEVEYRTTPKRNLESSPITRMPGIKLLASEFGERRISMRGHIIGTTRDDLRSHIDEMHRNVTRKDSGLLFMESDRSAHAVVESVTIADPHYSQTMVPFEIALVLPDPFFYGLQQVITIPVVSGTLMETTNITISGSVFAEPQITYTPPTGTGNTTTSGISIYYVSNAERVTWSGTGLSYGNNLTFDYTDHSVFEGITEVQPQGVFSRWEPEESSFITTYSGTAVGGTLQFAYQPRYL
jgi:hypothetical protein